MRTGNLNFLVAFLLLLPITSCRTMDSLEDMLTEEYTLLYENGVLNSNQAKTRGWVTHFELITPDIFVDDSIERRCHYRNSFSVYVYSVSWTLSPSSGGQIYGGFNPYMVFTEPGIYTAKASGRLRDDTDGKDYNFTDLYTIYVYQKTPKLETYSIELSPGSFSTIKQDYFSQRNTTYNWEIPSVISDFNLINNGKDISVKFPSPGMYQFKSQAVINSSDETRNYTSDWGTHNVKVYRVEDLPLNRMNVECYETGYDTNYNRGFARYRLTSQSPVGSYVSVSFYTDICLNADNLWRNISLNLHPGQTSTTYNFYTDTPVVEATIYYPSIEVYPRNDDQYRYQD